LGFCVRRVSALAQLSVLVGAAFWLWRGVFGFWQRGVPGLAQLLVFGGLYVSARLKVLAGAVSGGQNITTAAQQGAAPDHLQLRSSFLLSSLPAAGELGVVLQRAALREAK
jgi:hypothetical protein